MNCCAREIANRITQYRYDCDMQRTDPRPYGITPSEIADLSALYWTSTSIPMFNGVPLYIVTKGQFERGS